MFVTILKKSSGWDLFEENMFQKAAGDVRFTINEFFRFAYISLMF